VDGGEEGEAASLRVAVPVLNTAAYVSIHIQAHVCVHVQAHVCVHIQAQAYLWRTQKRRMPSAGSPK
jgi:hypothetical protein